MRHFLKKLGSAHSTRLELMLVFVFSLATVSLFLQAANQKNIHGTASAAVFLGPPVTASPTPTGPFYLKTGAITYYEYPKISVALSWGSVGGVNATYAIYQSTGADKPFTQIGKSDSNSFEAFVNGSNPNSFYVLGCSQTSPTGPTTCKKSNVASIPAQPAPTPAPPTWNLHLQTGAITHYTYPKISVALNWSKVEGFNPSYVVYQANKPTETFTQLGTTSNLSFTAFVNGSLPNYFYVLGCTSTSPSGPTSCSTKSNMVSIPVQPTPTP